MTRLLPCLLLSASLACAQQPYEGLNAVAWMQTAEEYRGGALQAFATARASLDRALKRRAWTAALEQSGKYNRLPPAIICDVDETLLDNSPAQARAIFDNNGQYDAKLWKQWTAERKAQAIPGAREFIAYARSRGVTVFYVTNRDQEEHEATRDNLIAQGFPVEKLEGKGLADTLLVLGEDPAWTSEKQSRRAAVARHYRILLLVGDDLGDFLAGSRAVPAAERRTLTAPREAWWGERWIIIPNPAYGSWERALNPAGKLKSLRRD
jgi:acid phosphatase